LDISIQKLFAKIENELMLAKESMDEARLREKVYSIKILCELILEEPGKIDRETILPAAITEQQMPLQNRPLTLTQPKKIEMNEEANGESLFDF
jgi:hypothetical protein